MTYLTDKAELAELLRRFPTWGHAALFYKAQSERLQAAIEEAIDGCESEISGKRLTKLAGHVSDRPRLPTGVATEFVIEGQPQPKQRARGGQGRHYTPPATKDAEDAIRWELRAKRVKPIAGDVAVSFRLFTQDHRRVDIDNIEKLIQDACNEFAYNDDSQIVEKHTYLVRADPRPRIEVRIEQVA